MNQTFKTIIAVIITAMVVGGGMYYWQYNQTIPASAEGTKTTTPAVVFNEAGLESTFTLPPGWTYTKLADGQKPDSMLPGGAGYDKKDIPGLDQFTFYDQKNIQAGGVSFFDANPTVETTFDGCWRGWAIQTSEANDGNLTYLPRPSSWILNHAIYSTNDNKTSIVVESCGMGAYIYWIPGALITDQHSLASLEATKSLRIMAIHGLNMNDNEFTLLVHTLAKSVRIGQDSAQGQTVDTYLNTYKNSPTTLTDSKVKQLTKVFSLGLEKCTAALDSEFCSPEMIKDGTYLGTISLFSDATWADGKDHEFYVQYGIEGPALYYGPFTDNILRLQQEASQKVNVIK